jgi:hypothetical protein
MASLAVALGTVATIGCNDGVVGRAVPNGAAGAAGGMGGGAGGSTGSAGAGGAASCPPPASLTCPPTPPSFANDIVPILDRSCNGCHAPNVPNGPWPLQDYADVAAWKDLIIPDLEGCTMPPADSGVAFLESERQLIFSWLVCGNPDN